MFNPFKRTKKADFDIKVLRRNDISLLILDERWNKLFSSTAKTPGIAACEERLKALIIEEAKLTAESKEIAKSKKSHMDKIIKLTPAVFEKNDTEAAKEMEISEKEIKRINERMKKIEEVLDALPDRKKKTNLELLEQTVNVVYFKMRSSRKRVEELEKLIEEERERLKQYIDEKESLAHDDTDIYSYFHDLLGAEELERLDSVFF